MISVYADGSSHAGGGKPGGWAYVVVRDDSPITAGSGNHPSTTNNVMELTGVLEGLRWLKTQGLNGELIEVVSDSQYALGIAGGGYTPTKNLDLATEVRTLAQELGITRFRWVRGHSGEVWNERCDSLAHDAKQLLVPEKVKKKQAKRKAAKEKQNGSPEERFVATVNAIRARAAGKALGERADLESAEPQASS